MKKKFLALVLTLAMVLSLVPVTALATNGTEGGASQENTRDNLTMKKTVIPNEDGTYTVRLESYATGSVTTTQTPVPMDFVLVLDVSGSMTDEIASYMYQATDKTSWSVSDVYDAYYDRGGWHRTDVTYYAQIGDEYYPVSYKQNWVSQGWFSGYYEYWLEANNEVLGHKVTDSTWEETVYDQVLYTRKTDSGKTVAKLDAMKTAVNNFIDSVAAQKNGETPVAHRISIVKFAGDSTNVVGNHKYNGGSYNYTQKVTELTDVTAAGSVDSLKSAVNDLTAGGATAADWGMQKANDVLTKRENKENPSIVIMFTDGEPNHGNGYGASVAGNTVQAAKGLKDGGTKVYTIGMFKDLQPSNADKVDTYMNGVSSNYPEAVKADNDSGVTLGNRAEGNYYFKADNASDLEQVFQTISESTTTTSPLDASAVVVDNVPSNFALNKESVQVYTEECTGKNEEGKLIWSENPVKSDIIPNIPEDKNEDGSQTISTTGFNFSQHWCGVDGDKPHGQKLIIEFTIERTNYGGTQPTNAGAYIKANADDEKEIINLNNPTVPVTISLGSKQELLKNPEVTDEKPYDGTGLAILPKIAEKANALATGTDNAYVNMDLTVTVDETTYTYKIPAGKTTGNWYQGDSADPMTPEQIADVTTPKDVKRDQESNEVEPYTYTFDLKLSDANPKGAESGAESKEYKDNNASFKITPRNVTLTSATDSKEYDGNPLTNNKITEGGDGFVKGEGATYTVTGSQTGVGESANKFTYTLKDGTTASNYNITTKFGKLTITKKEEVSYTVIFDANGGAWAEDVTIPDYTIISNGNKAIRENLTASDTIKSIAYPTKNGATMIGWGTQNGHPLYQLGLGSGVAVSSLKSLQDVDVQGNTITLYAIWKDDTTSADLLTYTINQHYIRSEKDEDNIGITGLSSKKGTEISKLIEGKAKDLDWRGNHYFYDSEKTTVNGTTLADNATLERKDTVIDLYYYLDNWKDADTTSGEDTDSETGGDGIPDCQQVKIQYLAYKENGGTVSRQVEIATFDNDTLNAIHGSTAKANSGFTFVTWSGRDVAVNDITVDNVIATTEPKSGPECKPFSTELVKGNAYTYTAIFLEDKIGDRNDDGTDKGDEIPDRYQVTINYVSSDTSKGSVGTLTKEVLTIYENGKEGKWASKGKVVASGSTATATGNRCYFVNWTKQQEGSTASSTVTSSANLPAQTIENAKGGDVYTFTANFDRSSGSGSGGSNRPKPPVVEIPDDVPTGLNGKDHYAYVVGYPDGMVYPQKNITRAEVATIFFRLLTDETREANMTKSNSYNDMKDGAWYTCAVSTLSKMGIIKGYEDGSFKPDASISRAEFAAIAARFDPDGDKTPATFSDVSSHWAKDEISIAANHGWIKGYEDGSFKPDQKITRAETMTLVNRVLKRLPETKDDLHKDMKTWPDNQNESAWFYLAVQEATNSHYQKLKKDGTHETWESMRETRDWAALEK